MKLKRSIILLLIIWEVSATDNKDDCYFADATTLFCTTTIPTVLEDKVNKVILPSFTERVAITPATFGGKGWSNVTYLKFDNRNTHYDQGKTVSAIF